MVHIISYPTPAKPDLKYAEAKRPQRQSVGSWLDDLAALGKALVLCGVCEKKLDLRRAGYERRKAVPGWEHVVGDCDGCGQWGQAHLYIPDHRMTYGGARQRGTADEIERRVRWR